MRNEFESFIVRYGSYWAIALLAVAISKLYSKEKQTVKTVLRSMLSSLVISYIIVEKTNGSIESGELITYIFLAGLCSDFIVEGCMKLGPAFINRFFGGKQ